MIQWFSIKTINVCWAKHENGPYAMRGRRRPRPACAFAQTGLDLRCPFKETIRYCRMYQGTEKAIIRLRMRRLMLTFAVYILKPFPLHCASVMCSPEENRVHDKQSRPAFASRQSLSVSTNTHKLYCLSREQRKS